MSVVDFFTRNRSAFRSDLETLCRIPSVSATSPDEVRRSANAVADVLRAYGVENVRLLESENAHPSVYGDWIRDEKAPTLLIYGHHDVQPTGPIDAWHSDPFEPVERDGRLYGRGTADDKGGVMAHLAAVRSCLAATGALPCNIKIFIEGEEEIGSPHLGDFLTRYRDLLAADVVVLNDTPNWATGTPALTYRLRGMVQVEVEVRVLDQPLHSGRGGGLVPDPIARLCTLIAELHGLPFLDAGVEPVTETHPAFSEEEFRASYGVRVPLLRDSRFTPLEQVWARPAMAVIGFDAPPVAGSFNQIAASARARLSIRTVPNLDSRAVGEEIVRRFTATPGVTAGVIASAPWWRIEPKGPAFDAARRALARGYGREPVMIGSGGSIAFIQSFADAFPGVPLILMGVEDPPCNAHSENESLHLGDWESCARSAIYLYEELHG